MPLMTWNDKYSVNIRAIDEQHRKLFSLINELHEAMAKGQGKEVLGRILVDLASYTVYHFSTEEKLFAAHGYPQAAEHREEHAALIKQVQEVKAEFDAGTASLPPKVLDFLRRWLNDHILGSDAKYGPFMNSKGVK